MLPDVLDASSPTKYTDQALGMGLGYGHWVWALGMGTGYGHWVWALDMGLGAPVSSSSLDLLSFLLTQRDGWHV